MKKLLLFLALVLAPVSAWGQTTTTMYRVDTIAALKAIPTSRPPIVIVMDVATGGQFEWGTTPCSAADDVFQVTPTSGPTGCWTRMANVQAVGKASPVSSVLSSSAGGVPSFSATLPSGLTIPSPTLTAPALGTIASGVLSAGTATASGASAAISMASRFGRTLSVTDFGALCDGSTNDTTAIQAALNAFSFGGVLRIPVGTCRFTTLTGVAGVLIVGDDPYASVLQTTASTGTVITLPVSSGLVNLKLTSSVTRTSGFHADITGNGVLIENVEFGNYYIAVNAGTLGGSLIVYPRIINSAFRDPAITSGAGGIQFINFSNAVVSGVVMTGPTSGDQPLFGIRYQNGDTAFLTDTNVTLHGKGLLIDPPASYNSYAISISNGVFDSAATVLGANVSSAVIQPAGGVYNTKIVNSWFGLSVSAFGLEIAPTGAGVVDGTTCTGCEFMANGSSGLMVNGTGALNTTITGGQSGGNTVYGLRFAGATTRFTVTGHRAGNVSARGANGYGIVVDNATASDWYSIIGNNLEGNTTDGLFDGGTGVNKIITGNLGTTVSAGLLNIANVTATGTLRANTAISANGTAGTSATISVRKGDDSGACNLVVTFGLVTSHTC